MVSGTPKKSRSVSVVPEPASEEPLDDDETRVRPSPYTSRLSVPALRTRSSAFCTSRG